MPTELLYLNDAYMIEFDATVVDVRKEGELVWHSIEGESVPAVGDTVHGIVDWSRRHLLMRTHTALHGLCACHLRTHSCRRHYVCDAGSCQRHT